MILHVIVSLQIEIKLEFYVLNSYLLLVVAVALAFFPFTRFF